MRLVLMYRGESGNFVAECPSLPGCVSQGLSREEAVAHIREAIEAYIQALKDKGMPVPDEKFDAILVAV